MIAKANFHPERNAVTLRGEFAEVPDKLRRWLWETASSPSLLPGSPLAKESEETPSTNRFHFA